MKKLFKRYRVRPESPLWYAILIAQAVIMAAGFWCFATGMIVLFGGD